MADVFISYANQDRERARLLADSLASSGFSVWWDRDIVAGDTYDLIIERELEAAKGVVVLWSRDSILSDWVKTEAQEAAAHATLIPAIIDAVKPPLEFRRRQTIDLVSWNGDLAHPGFDALKRSLLAHLSGSQTGQPPAEATATSEKPTGAGTDPPIEIHRAEKPLRGSIRWHACLIGALFAAAAIVGVWDAFFRQHVTHFANVTKLMGKPQGIGALSAEQFRHRNASLAFFSRGRFGPVTEIRVVNSRNQYPRDLSFVPPSSLSDLNPLATGMMEPLRTVRVTFEYRDRDVVEQSAYDRSDHQIYRFRYGERDVAEYKWELFSREMRESGITHVRFVRPQEGPQAGRDTEVLYLDGVGSGKPNRVGSYGLHQMFDARGQPIQAVSLGVDYKPTPTRPGVARVERRYDLQGNVLSERKLGADGRPIADGFGVAIINVGYDTWGNTTSVEFLDPDGRLVTDGQLGVAKVTRQYDEAGNVVEIALFGTDAKLDIGSGGFAKQSVVWNDDGTTYESYFGIDGKPIVISGFVVHRKGIWDDRGRVIEGLNLDEHDKPVRSAAGCARFKLGYDPHGNLADESCLDQADQATRTTSGFSRVKRIFDERANKVEEAYFGPSGKEELYEANFVKIRMKHDQQGKRTETSYLDGAHKLVRNQDGVARETRAYDVEGHVRQISFFDESGSPVLRKGGYARIVREYDGYGRLAREITQDVHGNPVQSDGYAESRHDYDHRGYRTTMTLFDEHGRAAADKNGCTSFHERYNDKGQRTEWACHGPDGAPIIARRDGYSRTISLFDEFGRISRVTFLDASGRPIDSSDGYAEIRYRYDAFGRETARAFFGADGKSVQTRVRVKEVEEGMKSQRVGLRVGDVITAYDGRAVVDDRHFGELELNQGERPRDLTVERDGKTLTLSVPSGRLQGLETTDSARVIATRPSRATD